MIWSASVQQLAAQRFGETGAAIGGPLDTVDG